MEDEEQIYVKIIKKTQKEEMLAQRELEEK